MDVKTPKIISNTVNFWAGLDSLILSSDPEDSLYLDGFVNFLPGFGKKISINNWFHSHTEALKREGFRNVGFCISPLCVKTRAKLGKNIQFRNFSLFGFVSQFAPIFSFLFRTENTEITEAVSIIFNSVNSVSSVRNLPVF